ncbi:MFS transporter [Pseudonocardia sp. HH130630-07]|uniref:MFS transporter n=1 Tax=Pseudonocardia sp. HH130630-07 TaxID=1690815 RepID=UPI0008151514|nr:MFS transporter [Pseudonocardia sp. HH130630-07]ANY06919.1 chemotaxis protein [Pseudonocardia sp. HH130630-07]
MSTGTTPTRPDDDRGTPRATTRLPGAVYLLGLSLFAIGSSEFLIAGVLPPVAADLDVSLPAAGTLISAYAMGVVVGAPPLALLTLRWSRRTTLIASQVVFVAATTAGMLVEGYWPLLISRVVVGLAYAGFWAAAMVTALHLVTPDRAARALAVVVGGLSLAMVLGGPLGTLISDVAGWRAGFWALAAATAATAVATAIVLPAGADQGPPRDVRGELRTMLRPRLWIAYGTTVLSTGSYMVTYSYIAGILTDVSRLDQRLVPAVLALFGIGAVAGLTVGGRIADRYPFPLLAGGLASITVLSGAMLIWASNSTIMVVLFFLLGFAAFVLNPAVHGRVFAIGADAPTLAGAVNVSAFQVGITLAAAVGGVAITATGRLTAIAWVGIAGAILALSTVAVDARWPLSVRKPESPS